MNVIRNLQKFTLHNVKRSSFLSTLQGTSCYGLSHIRPQPLVFVTKKRGFCEKVEKTEHGELVYEGGIASMVRGVKFFSLSTSLIGLGLQPYLIMNIDQLGKAGFAVGGMCSFFIITTPLLLHWVTKKYVTQLYYDRDSQEFTAFTVSFFLRKIMTKFTANDVTVPEVPGIFTTLVAKDKQLFVDMNFFKDMHVYKHMMGYDKPIDWAFPDNIKKYQENQSKES